MAQTRRRSRRLSITPMKNTRRSSINPNISRLLVGTSESKTSSRQSHDRSSRLTELVQKVEKVNIPMITVNSEVQGSASKINKETSKEKSPKRNKKVSSEQDEKEGSNLKNSESMEKMLKQISSVLGLAENKKKKSVSEPS